MARASTPSTSRKPRGRTGAGRLGRLDFLRVWGVSDIGFAVGVTKVRLP